MTDVSVGSGAEAVPQKTVTVHYTGWLQDLSKPDHHGTQFDSSRTNGETVRVRARRRHGHQGLGSGRGWHEGGGKRTLVIPPDMGYGARGVPGVIPPRFDADF